MDYENFDEIMNYERVRAFINLYETAGPHTVASDFLWIINRNLDMTAGQILDVLVNHKYRPEHWRIINDNRDDALYAAEYYIIWNKLSLKDKKGIQWARRAKFENKIPEGR